MSENKTKTWIRLNQIHEHVGEEVTFKGWLQNKRSSGKVQFLLLRDGTGVIQAVMGKKDVPAETFDLTGELTQESSLKATGVVRQDSRAPGG